MLLLRRKGPRKLFRTISIEMDFKSTSVFYGYQPVGFESTCPDFRRSGKTGSGAEHSVEGNCCIGCSKGEHNLCGFAVYFSGHGGCNRRTTAEVYINKALFLAAYACSRETLGVGLSICFGAD